VRIVPALDETPLPNLAERVGPQFTIAIDGGELAMPAQLTLPADADTVERFGQGASDVKVWVRDGEGWTLREAIEAQDGSITIDLASPTTAAAGVRIAVGSLLCGAAGPGCIDPACLG